MKWIIAGTRTFNDYKLLTEVCNQHISSSDEIVSGTAKGADRLGEAYAIDNKLDLKRFPADWEQFGKRAGYLRNVQMGEYADAAIIFWDGQSKGAQHMINIMKNLNKPHYIITY